MANPNSFDRFKHILYEYKILNNIGLDIEYVILGFDGPHLGWRVYTIMQRRNTKMQPLKFRFFKKMLTQNRLFSFCINKNCNLCQQKKPSQNRLFFFKIDFPQMIFICYFLSLHNKLQEQIKLIAVFIYFLIRNNTFQSLCNMYDPCYVCHLQKEAKRRKVIAQNSAANKG